MKVIIPVAGVGSRLRPHTYSTPKVMLHVAGRPILDHVLEPVSRLEPEEVIFVVGFLGEQISEYVTAHYRFKATFIRQNELRGLGYALSLGLKQCENGPVLVVLGDTVVEADLAKFVTAGDYVLGLRQVADPHRFGIAVLNGGHVSDLEEKPTHPKTNLAVIGLYYFHESQILKSALEEHVASGKTTRGEVQFTDALQKMIESGCRFVPYEVNDWFDCGKKETMLETNRHLLKKVANTTALEGSTIIPPVFLGPGVTVQNSVIGPYVAISENGVVDQVIIRNSIVGPNARISRTILEDSLIGRGAMIQGMAHQVNIGDSSETTLS